MEIDDNKQLDILKGSQLKFYSIGIVAENKKMSHSRILVTPIETLGMSDGEIKSSPEKLETKGIDYDFNEYTVSAIADNAIEADWFPLNDGNRRTPPDVRRGERVVLYQYGDEGRYWWQPYGLDGRLRKLETAIYSWSGTKDEKEDSERPENSYYAEVSTHEKRITIATSGKNGEKCRYVVQINPGEGKILIVDDKGNEFEMDSVNTLLHLKNADGTYIDLDKKNINVYAEDYISIKAGKAIIANAGDKITMKAPQIELDGITKVTKTFQVQGTSKFDAPMVAAGITSPAPIVGPTDTI